MSNKYHGDKRKRKERVKVLRQQLECGLISEDEYWSLVGRVYK